MATNKAVGGVDVSEHLGLVYREAEKICLDRRGSRRQRLLFPELVQEGTIGLIKAARRFRPELGFKFSSYAVPWIRGAIYRAICRFWDEDNRQHQHRAPTGLLDEQRAPLHPDTLPDRDHVSVLFSCLSRRDRRLLTLRFGLHDGRPLSYAQMARRLRKSKPRVHQLVTAALARLREAAALFPEN